MNNALKGSLYIALGAACYGMLGTFVKMAYHDGFSIAEVTLSQFALGFAGLFILTLFRKKNPAPDTKTSGYKGKLKLTVAGTSLGLTSIFYYMAVRYIPVSVAIVLLMQTVWMGVILESAVHKKAPGLRKILSVVTIMGGTVLATNLLEISVSISRIGLCWGIMAAFAYTATMYSSNNIGLDFPPLKRSLYMILGGLFVIAIVFHSALNKDFSFGILLGWGLAVSLFGTILPPLLFTRGMPLVGMGLGSIIASIEIPVAVLMAHLILKEPVTSMQWAGVSLILFAVVLLNIGKRKIQ